MVSARDFSLNCRCVSWPKLFNFVFSQLTVIQQNCGEMMYFWILVNLEKLKTNFGI